MATRCSLFTFLVIATMAAQAFAYDPEEVEWEKLSLNEAANLIADKPQACPEHEYYRQCGSYCPETCATLNKPVACPNVCRAGCFCRRGRVRDITGNCVRPSECSVQGSPRDLSRDSSE
ncbi:cysteine-rich venom protein 6 [Ischnura elegans]|uniref:cysteine-rich venom protein 6 n=1 Tax=Ischnura elegans TaxID=197161 RepID=UPI001ED88E89|nr:cysteine-rich venom protein 6 [Ischnura elegans]